jgi:hypothetical protein
MKKFKCFCLAVLLMGLGACATVGNEFPSDYASTIVIGKTTRAQVEKQLGAPYRTGLDSGDPTASYQYYRLGLFVDTVTKDLTIRFDAQGTVKSYTYNASAPAAAEKVDYNAR